MKNNTKVSGTKTHLKVPLCIHQHVYVGGFPMVTVTGKQNPLCSTYISYTHSLQLYIPQCFSELDSSTLIITCTHFLIVTQFLQEQKGK
jgi:hypothetical protein